MNSVRLSAGEAFSLASVTAQQPLDHQHVAPLAVELAVAAVQADRGEAAALDQAEAGGVVCEELADQLVKAIALRGGSERFGQGRTDTATPRIGGDVDAALRDPGVARSTPVGGESSSADNSR